MKFKFLALSVLAALGCVTFGSDAEAVWNLRNLRPACRSMYTMRINVSPYNAFTPFCAGNVYCQGMGFCGMGGCNTGGCKMGGCNTGCGVGGCPIRQGRCRSCGILAGRLGLRACGPRLHRCGPICRRGVGGCSSCGSGCDSGCGSGCSSGGCASADVLGSESYQTGAVDQQALQQYLMAQQIQHQMLLQQQQQQALWAQYMNRAGYNAYAGYGYGVPNYGMVPVGYYNPYAVQGYGLQQTGAAR